MASEHRLRVAVAQVDTRLGDLPANLDKHLDYIARARERGVDLLVFPETSLTGFPHTFVLDHGVRRQGPEVERIAAASGDMVVVFGMVEEAPAAQFYNTCIVMAEGRIGHIHRKLNLATYGALEEGKFFAQGRYVDAFDLDSGPWRLSALICADLWNPPLVHLAALHGATLLAVPTNSAHSSVSTEFSNPANWDLATRFYAMIYGMPIVMANRVGTEATLTFWGGSRIVDPFGQVLAEADNTEEALVDAEVDYNAVRKARIQLPTVRDSNLALVQREITRLEPLVGVPSSVRRA